MTNNVTLGWLQSKQNNYRKIFQLLEEFGKYLPEPLETVVDLAEYAAKIDQNADVMLAQKDSQVAGILAVYVNDVITKLAYITIVSVGPCYRRLGIGRQMVEEAIQLATIKGFKVVRLQANTNNVAAMSLYRSIGFKTVDIVGRKSILEAPLTE